MRLLDRVTMLLNDVISIENKTQYQEGKQDGLYVALREIESFPSLFLVRMFGDAERDNENESLLVFALNKERAVESAKKETQSLPYITTYEVEEIAPECRKDNRVFWM